MDQFGLTDRDHAFAVLGPQDWDAQLRAIHDLLSLQRSAESKVSSDIHDLENLAQQSSGDYADRVVDESVDLMHGSVFQGAAHSLSAVGMLAPFVESMFCNAFPGIRDHLQQLSIPLDTSARASLHPDKVWDAHFNNFGSKNVVEGIMALAAMTGLDTYLPNGFRVTLTALFGYRNRNLHHGFEWPQAERDKFWARIPNEGWSPTWFEHASSDHKIWVIYMTSDFIAHCLATIDGFLEGMGRFVVATYPSAPPRPGAS